MINGILYHKIKKKNLLRKEINFIFFYHNNNKTKNIAYNYNK